MNSPPISIHAADIVPVDAVQVYGVRVNEDRYGDSALCLISQLYQKRHGGSKRREPRHVIVTKPEKLWTQPIASGLRVLFDKTGRHQGAKQAVHGGQRQSGTSRQIRQLMGPGRPFD
jgi:hypothetical protein